MDELGGFLAGLKLESWIGYPVLIIIALMVITEKLVWHKRVEKMETQFSERLTKAEEQRDKWEGIALTALGTAEKMTVQAELTNTFLSKLPDPANEEEP